MPYLKIQTNLDPQAETLSSLLQQASQNVAESLGKPERYVMVAVDTDVPMLFAGEASPTVYMELKSIGLPEQETARLSAALCQLVNDHLDIPTNRVYIEFANAERHMWGWDGDTF